METLNNIEKITLLISISVVALVNLSIIVDKVKMKLGMKRFTKLSLAAIFCMSSILMKSQDTIYFKDKSVIAVKISEVDVNEITYQHLDNLDGPKYQANKRNLFLIKYSNGSVDSIKLIPVVSSSINEIKNGTDEVWLSGSKIIYHNKTISDNQLKSMMEDHFSSEKQLLLKKEFNEFNEYKIKEGALAPALFLTGAMVHCYALLQLSNMVFESSDPIIGVSALVLGAALRITGHIVNKVYRNKKISKREDIVNMYNGHQ